MVARIREAYEQSEPHSVQLQQFLQPHTYELLRAEIKKTKFKYETIPDQHGRKIGALSPSAKKLLKTQLVPFIQAITRATWKGVAVFEQYGHRDFTLRKDDVKPQGLLVYLDFTAEWDAGWGGATIVTDEEGELARVVPQPNTLVLIDCSKSYPFTQYVNHYAGKNAIVRLVLR